MYVVMTVEIADDQRILLEEFLELLKSHELHYKGKTRPKVQVDTGEGDGIAANYASTWRSR